MGTAIEEGYQRWTEGVDAEDRAELEELGRDPEALEDAFYRELAFGTAGLRGKLGLGPNRMNVYTVGKATQGLATYLNAHFDEPAVAVCRDSRHGGEAFVRRVAEVLAANGIRSYAFPRVEPTPALSFATRDLGCAAGINVTASHNPAVYNGYKVYGPDGCQIASEAAAEIQATVDATDPFADVKRMPYEEAVAAGLACEIGDETLQRFCDAVLTQSTGQDCSGVSVVYTPLNGTGLECVSEVLGRIGVTDIHVVPEQAQPDGSFATCPYPNPEIREALELGLRLCDEVHPDLLLANDPDADRVGIAVPHGGEYVLLSGNEVGILLSEFRAQRALQAGEDLSQKLVVTTVVSAPMMDDIAADLGFELHRTLTGFKYIGEQIAILEEEGREGDFLFGFEESYGYLAGTHARDKDAVVASMLICELAAYWKEQGKDLYEAMETLYERYGFWGSRSISVAYEGSSGAARMSEIMASLGANPPEQIGGLAVQTVRDYSEGLPMAVVNGHAGEPAQTLPAAALFEFQLEGGSRVLVRPSGTEPKIKAYVFAKAEGREEADGLMAKLSEAARALL